LETKTYNHSAMLMAYGQTLLLLIANS